MKKEKPLKFILLIFVIELIIIGFLGLNFERKIVEMEQQIENGEITHLSEVKENYNQIHKNINIIMFFGIFILGTITVVLAIYLSKMVIYPLKKMIESNEKKGRAEETGIKKRLLHMTEGIIAFDIDGKIDLINPAAKLLLKISPEDENFEDIFSKYNLNMEKMIYLDELTSMEQKINVEDKFVKIIFAPFRNEENNKPEGIIAVIQDITEQMNLNNMRKEFVADVSHELKTPITSIMGYADTLLEGEYEKEIQDKFLNVIASEARRMAKLVSDLLTLSRYDNSQTRVEKTEFDLGELVKKCQDKLAIEIKKKGHEVNCFVTADVPLVYADKGDVERVVLNILSNSIKYTQDNGKISIYVGFVYNDAYIKILDNGIGIPEEDLSKIFERFYRVDKARTREMGGTGLGLSIAKDLLDKNGGSIDIKSIVGEGTEVVIKVPTKVK